MKGKKGKLITKLLHITENSLYSKCLMNSHLIIYHVYYFVLLAYGSSSLKHVNVNKLVLNVQNQC